MLNETQLANLTSDTPCYETLKVTGCTVSQDRNNRTGKDGGVIQFINFTLDDGTMVRKNLNGGSLTVAKDLRGETSRPSCATPKVPSGTKSASSTP